MGKNVKGTRHTKREEKQAQKVLVIIGVSALILLLIMLIGYSFLGQ